jgi:hypothetical protein
MLEVYLWYKVYTRRVSQLHTMLLAVLLAMLLNVLLLLSKSLNLYFQFVPHSCWDYYILSCIWKMGQSCTGRLDLSALTVTIFSIIVQMQSCGLEFRHIILWYT